MKKFFAKNKKIIVPILITFLCLLVWRIGVHITLPLINPDALTGGNQPLFGFLDVFTGGALSQFSVVALGISPYITASIVIQLLQMDIVPIFKEWAEEGEAGKQKLNQVTLFSIIPSICTRFSFYHRIRTIKRKLCYSRLMK